ncbi:MAG: hypothetical protein H6713_23185 [Myxococcales bacterium]|nr:hypothetical protein [Myxococcales bacterium]
MTASSPQPKGPPPAAKKPAGRMPQGLPKGYGPRRSRVPAAYKLWMGAIIANLAGVLAAVYIAKIIRGIPASTGTETALLAVYYTMMVIAAVVDALWLDEVLFKGGFRRSHLQGQDGRQAQSGDVEEAAASMQRSSFSFPVLLILSGLFTYLLFNFINNDFDNYYRRVGKHVTSLRGDNPENATKRLAAIGELSIRRDPEIIPILTRQLERGGDVAVWAAWAMGRFKDVPAKRRRPLVEPLLAASRSDDRALRREAIVALARLQYRPIASQLKTELRSDIDSLSSESSIDLRLLYAAGHVQSMELVPLLEEILRGKGSVEAQQAAAWALFQHIDQRGGRDVVPILEERLPAAPLAVRCAIVHSLGYTGDENSNRALIHAYDTATPEERATRCGIVSFNLRPDGGDERVDLFMPRDSFEMKILQAMGQIRATTPEVRAAVEPWLARVVEGATDDLKRSRAESLLSGIQSARDDRLIKQLPSEP